MRAFLRNIFLLKFLLCAAMLLISLEQVRADPTAGGKPHVEVLLDLSSSMSVTFHGKTRWALAKDAVLELLTAWPNDIEFGLRVFGHRKTLDQKEQSCVDSELLLPVDTHLISAVSQALSSLTPHGFTPLAFSLRQVRNDFESRKISGQRAVIILFSDGQDSCDGDPVGEIEALRREGFSVQIHAIGISPDRITMAELGALALVSGGTFTAVDSPDALLVASASVLEMARKNFPVSAKPIPVHQINFGTQRLHLQELIERFEFECLLGDKFLVLAHPGETKIKIIRVFAPDGNVLAILRSGRSESEVIQSMKSGNCQLEIENRGETTETIELKKMMGN